MRLPVLEPRQRYLPMAFTNSSAASLASIEPHGDVVHLKIA